MIATFRHSGKLTWAELSAPDTLAFHVGSAAETVRLDATTTLDAIGLRLQAFFLRDALSELGIEADLLRIGAYKGAYEELALSGPTPELEESLQDLMDSLYGSMIESTAAARKLDPGALRGLLDRAPLRADEALATRLVDELQDGDDTRERLQSNSRRPVHLLPLEEYLAAVRAAPRARTVAVIHVLGAITEGESQVLPLLGLTSGAVTISRALQEAAGDDSVAGILLRIDSPGGVASAAEKINSAVQAARKAKPVVASFGGAAASGGYYAACGADHICAHPMSLTGSIGVFGGKIVIDDFLARHRVAVRTYTRGQHAAILDFTQKYSPEERITLKAILEGTYRRFVDRVAVGRTRSFEEVEGVAQGRVWTGKAALAAGLVDQIGGLDDALAKLRELARIDPAVPMEPVLFPPPATFWEALTSPGRRASGTVVNQPGLDAMARSLVDDLERLRCAGFLSGTSQLALMPLAIDVR